MLRGIENSEYRPQNHVDFEQLDEDPEFYAEMIKTLKTCIDDELKKRYPSSSRVYRIGHPRREGIMNVVEDYDNLEDIEKYAKQYKIELPTREQLKRMAYSRYKSTHYGIEP